MKLEKLRTENLKFSTDLRDRVMDGWSVTQLMNVYKRRLLKNLQIENQSSSCQRWSIHGSQIQHIICNQFGCKLWLLSIQNDIVSKLLRVAI